MTAFYTSTAALAGPTPPPPPPTAGLGVGNLVGGRKGAARGRRRSGLIPYYPVTVEKKRREIQEESLTEKNQNKDMIMKSKTEQRAKRIEDRGKRGAAFLQKDKKTRAQPGSNQRPIDLQSIALPLSYKPYVEIRGAETKWSRIQLAESEHLMAGV